MTRQVLKYLGEFDVIKKNVVLGVMQFFNAKFAVQLKTTVLKQ